MKYPKFLKSNDTIGVCAPSFGCNADPYYSRLKSAIDTFQKLGYKVRTTESTYKLEDIRSTSSEQRAKEFHELYFNKDVDFISSAGGGEVMMEIMPYIDFDKIKQSEPKWFIGYSDNTWLSFALPTICDVAAFYGYNLPEFGPKDWDQSLCDCYKMITNQITIQHSYSKYEKESLKHQPGMALVGIQADTPASWKNINQEVIDIEGRFIGGCLDVLLMFIGTPFDNVHNFLEKYKDDGFVWFFESCDLSIIAQLRAYWQLNQCGWFKYCKGIIIGRPFNRQPAYGLEYEDILKSFFKDLPFPVIYDVDIGHIAPIHTYVNGSYVKIHSEKGKGTIETIYK